MINFTAAVLLVFFIIIFFQEQNFTQKICQMVTWKSNEGCEELLPIMLQQKYPGILFNPWQTSQF